MKKLLFFKLICLIVCMFPLYSCDSDQPNAAKPEASVVVAEKAPIQEEVILIPVLKYPNDIHDKFTEDKLVHYQGLWGFIDKTGAMVINPQFE